MKNKLSELRDHLFAQLEAVREATDENLAKEVSRAQSVSDISRVLIESAKVEIDYYRHIGGEPSASTRTKPPLKPNTLKQYEAACERLKENFADFEPRKVLQRHVVALKLHMADTPNMSNRVISVLRAVFAYALEQQIVDSNPCIGVRRHLEHKRDRYITHSEFQAICANSSDNMRVIYETTRKNWAVTRTPR